MGVWVSIEIGVGVGVLMEVLAGFNVELMFKLELVL